MPAAEAQGRRRCGSGEALGSSLRLCLSLGGEKDVFRETQRDTCRETRLMFWGRTVEWTRAVKTLERERERERVASYSTVQSGKSFLSMGMEDADGWPGPLFCNGHYRSFETMNVLLFYPFLPLFAMLAIAFCSVMCGICPS